MKNFRDIVLDEKISLFHKADKLYKNFVTGRKEHVLKKAAAHRDKMANRAAQASVAHKDAAGEANYHRKKMLNTVASHKQQASVEKQHPHFDYQGHVGHRGRSQVFGAVKGDYQPAKSRADALKHKKEQAAKSAINWHKRLSTGHMPSFKREEFELDESLIKRLNKFIVSYSVRHKKAQAGGKLSHGTMRHLALGGSPLSMQQGTKWNPQAKKRQLKGFGDK